MAVVAAASLVVAALTGATLEARLVDPDAALEVLQTPIATAV